MNRGLMIVACLLICGCASRLNTDLLKARIREQAAQITESQRETQQTRAELDRSRQELDQLRSEVAQVNLTEGRASPATGQISRLHIYSLGSGGMNKDQVPGDDAVVVQFAPFDRNNTALKLPGTVDIELLDPELPETESVLGHWNFTEAECGKHWTRGVTGTGFQLTLPLKVPVEHSDLIVKLRFKTANDTRFETSQVVRVAVTPPEVASQQRRPVKQTVQVVDDSLDPPPPVGTATINDDWGTEEPGATKPKSGRAVMHSANWTDSTIPVLR